MTRKTNKLFFLGGAVAALLAFAIAGLGQGTGSDFAEVLFGVLAFTAWGLLVVGGVVPWFTTFYMKYPLQATDGYTDDYAAEPQKEAGGYMSPGWRRKRERAMLRNMKAFGLYIEPDEKS